MWPSPLGMNEQQDNFTYCHPGSPGTRGPRATDSPGFRVAWGWGPSKDMRVSPHHGPWGPLHPLRVEASGKLPLECWVISADTALTGWGSVLLEESWNIQGAALFYHGPSHEPQDSVGEGPVGRM